MRKSKLKQIHDEAAAYSKVNDIFIEVSLDDLEKDTISDEERKRKVGNLRKELELREQLKTNMSHYQERKAEDRGYWVAVAGCMIGIVLYEVGPVVFARLNAK